MGWGKRVKKFGQGSPPPFSGNAQKKKFLTGYVPLYCEGNVFHIIRKLYDRPHGRPHDWPKDRPHDWLISRMTPGQILSQILTDQFRVSHFCHVY